MKKPEPIPTPDHALHRFMDGKELVEGIKAMLESRWHLHSWYPAVEMFEQVDQATGHHDRWPVTVFYALFWKDQPRGDIGPMAVR